MNFCFLFFIFSISLFSQRADFYDTYDYNLRNLKGGETLGNEENYREYDLPPKFQKQPLIDPKNVRRQQDLSSLLQGRTGIRQSANQQNGGQPTQNQNLPFNPITGQVDPAAILQQREKQKLAKERKERLLHSEKEPYTETRERRMEVIFTTTFPFAFAFMTVLAYAIDLDRVNENRSKAFFEPKDKTRFINTTPGFLFVSLGATVLSGVNAYIDIKYYDDYMRKKELNKASSIDELNSEKNYSMSFTLGSKNF